MRALRVVETVPIGAAFEALLHWPQVEPRLRPSLAFIPGDRVVETAVIDRPAHTQGAPHHDLQAEAGDVPWAVEIRRRLE